MCSASSSPLDLLHLSNWFSAPSSLLLCLARACCVLELGRQQPILTVDVNLGRNFGANGREALVAVVVEEEEERATERARKEGLGGRRGGGDGEDRRRQQVSEAKLNLGREGGREGGDLSGYGESCNSIRPERAVYFTSGREGKGGLSREGAGQWGVI